ncbi:MAG: efflux transporter outer membrane subunit [Nevskiales bacterium]|nr:efflux transporter outer membrane subunit [Nevskiales bacterium]
MSLKHSCALLAALAVGACSVTPQRGELAPELPAGFDAAGTATAPALWWTAFSDPQLDALTLQALAANPGLQVIEARLRAARAGTRAAAAGLWPSVSASASRTEGFDGGRDNDSSSAGLAASYEVDLWGRVRARRESAALSAQATAEELQAAQISLSANVASLWFRIGTTRRRLELIEQDRARYARILSLVEQRFRNGQTQASEVLRQRQLLESTQALAASTRADLGVQRHALDELLGEPAGRAAYAGAAARDLPPVPATGVPAGVVNRRPDVRQSWSQLLAADRDVAAAIANRFPQLGLDLTYSSTDAGVAELFDDWIGSLVGSVALPLIDGGARRAEVERTRAVLDQRVAAYRQTVLAAFREIQDALLQDRQQDERVTSLTEQLRLSDASVERLVTQLRNGQVEYPSLLEAQVSNSALRRDLLTARQQQAEFRIALYRALAGPLPAAPTSVREPA